MLRGVSGATVRSCSELERERVEYDVAGLVCDVLDKEYLVVALSCVDEYSSVGRHRSKRVHQAAIKDDDLSYSR